MNVDMHQTAILRGDGTPETLEEHLSGLNRHERRDWLRENHDCYGPRPYIHDILPLKRLKKGKPGRKGAGVSR